MLDPKALFDLDGHRFATLFEGVDYPWQALPRIAPLLRETLAPNVGALGVGLVQQTTVLHDGKVYVDGLSIAQGDVKKGGLEVTLDGEKLEGASVIQGGAYLASDDIEIGSGTLVESGAFLRGPTIILDLSEIRQGAYIRGKVLVGSKCVVGHATEVKASVLLGGSQAGHFAYLGDSILGAVNLGAGTKLANLKVFPGTVSVRVGDETIDTGLRKLGAILGEGVELGCNSVTTPGTVLGRKAVVYPNTTVRGVHAAESIIKGKE